MNTHLHVLIPVSYTHLNPLKTKTMINYSISLRANPSDQDAPKKAYANAQ